MEKRRYQLVTQTFTGPRFRDHGLDIDVLPELIAYKKILIETAKEIWWRKHPDRERIQRNFEASLRLKFYRLVEGSVAIPLEREIEIEEGTFDFAIPRDELDEAVDLVEDAIAAGSDDNPLPESFPKNVIPLFEQLGRTLEADEAIEFDPPNTEGARKRVVYNARVRLHILERATGEFTDLVTLTGEVRAADLDGSSFILRRPDGAKLPGRFSPEHEDKITQALKEHESCSIAVEGSATFHPDGQFKRIETITNLHVIPKQGMPYREETKPIWEIASEIAQEVPAEDWDSVPTDASRRLDHYLSGG